MNNFINLVNSKTKHILISVALIILYASTVYIVDEGNVGVVKRFGEAVNSVGPGVHFKAPFIDDIVEIEVRTRKYQLTMSASTTGRNPDNGEVELQMPSNIVISANWSIPKDKALEVYKEYGSLQMYEDRILDPRVTRVTKQVFPHYNIEQVISDRETVRSEIASALKIALQDHFVNLTDVNIEDITFHAKIAEAVTKKQVAKLQLEEQRDILATQDLQAKEATNTAIARANGIKAISIQKAAAIQREGEATAKALVAKGAALKENPNLIALVKAEKWNGVRSTHVLGGEPQLLLSAN